MKRRHEEEIAKVKKKFKDVICHIEAEFLAETIIESPKIPPTAENPTPFPGATFWSLKCSECGKRYCIQVSLDESKFFEIKDEVELGDYIAEMYKGKL